jgi:hypothetical protein
MEDGPRRVKFVPVKGDCWRNETVQGHISVPVTGKRRRGQTEQLEEMQPRRRGRPRKTIPEPTIPTNREGVHNETALLDQELSSVVPLLDLAGAEIQQELPSAEMQPRGRPRTIPNLVQNYDAELLEKTRKDLVDARVQFEDDR